MQSTWKLKNTVFLIAPVQFSVVRILILFNIQFSNTVQNTNHIFMFFMGFFSTDFVGFHKILLIVRSCMIFCVKSQKFQKACKQVQRLFSSTATNCTIRVYSLCLHIQKLDNNWVYPHLVQEKHILFALKKKSFYI